MTKLLMIGALVALPAAASADDSVAPAAGPAPRFDTYIEVAALVDGIRAVHVGGGAGVGHRIADTPLFGRVMIAGGAAGTDGSFAQIRAGIEARGCTSRRFCGFGGIDAGYQHDAVDDTLTNFFGPDTQFMTVADDVLLIPRFGVEVGGPHVKLRVAAEVVHTMRIDEHETQDGFSMMLGIVGAF